MPHDTTHTIAIVSLGCDNPGYCRSVSVPIFDVCGVGYVIPAVDIIICWIRIGPLVIAQVGMGKIDTAIDDGNYRRLRARGSSPGADSIDIGTELASALTGVLNRPLF